ncbi:MAG: S9 family peptidase [Nocardioidaceae bacterium]
MKSELTAELITSTWHPEGVHLSPDGRRVAWSASPYGQTEEHGESAVWVAGVDPSESARRWTRGGNDTDPRWSPDGSLLGFRSDRKVRGTHGLYVIRADGGEAAPLVVRERSIGAFCWSPDCHRIAFCAPDEPNEDDKRREEERDDHDVYGERSQYHRIHLVELGSGEVTTLVGDDRHVVDVAWGPDGSVVAFIAQDTPEPDEITRRSLWIVDVEGGNPRRIVAGPFLDGLAWTPDGSALVYVTSHDPLPQSSFSVWTTGIADGDRPRCIGTRREETACSIAVRPADRDRVAILVLEGLGNRLELTTRSPGERTLLYDAAGDISAFDVSAGTVAVVAELGGSAPEVWAGSAADIRQVSNHHAAWSTVAFGAVEDFTYRATDGIPLDGVVIRPPDGTDGPNATVVLVHGGPYGRSGRALHCSPLSWGQWLANAGYTVLMPNYRGGAGHGDRFAASVRADMGGAEWGDVLSAVDAAVDRGIADPARLGVGGWSQGGFLTAWAVTQTDRFKAAVMGAGVSDWGAMAALSDLPTFETALAGDTPWAGPGPHRAAQRSPISYANERRTPLLILHGQEDIRVPIGQATAFHRALRSQQAPVELVTYPREPHGIAERVHQLDLLRRVRDWYARWLPLS